jgi:hypothetical protein
MGLPTTSTRTRLNTAEIQPSDENKVENKTRVLQMICERKKKKKYWSIDDDAK